MTATEFNALPLEARRFIEANAGCLSCGGSKEAKLTKAYALYKTHSKMTAFQLKGGGINYVKEGKGGVLYPIGKDDTDDEIREKIAIAKEIHEAKPHVFLAFNEKAMETILEGLEPAEVVNLDAEKEEEAAAPARGNGGKFQKKQTPAPAADDEI